MGHKAADWAMQASTCCLHTHALLLAFDRQEWRSDVIISLECLQCGVGAAT